MLFVPQSVERVDARGRARWKNAGHKADKSAKSYDGHNEPEWAVEEVHRCTAEARGDEVDEEIENFAFDDAENDTT